MSDREAPEEALPALVRTVHSWHWHVGHFIDLAGFNSQASHVFIPHTLLLTESGDRGQEHSDETSHTLANDSSASCIILVERTKQSKNTARRGRTGNDVYATSPLLWIHSARNH